MSILVIALVLSAQPTPLLDGRLLVRLPEDMPVSDGGDRTVAELQMMGTDDAPGRFVMVAEERFASPGPDFAAAVAADLARGGGSVARAKLDVIALPGLAAVTVRPRLPVRPGDDNLVLAVYVASGDASVQIFAFYVFGVARERAAEWEAIAEQIAGTLAAGQGGLRREAGVLALGERGARVDCRDDCVVRRAPAGYELRLITPLAHSAACVLTDGLQPEPEVPAARTTRRGRWIEWRAGRDYHAIASRDGVHASCTASTPALRGELERHADTLEPDAGPADHLTPTWQGPEIID